ncbi:uncharacterized protein BDR25DRAFT_350749 [Lindgomyces ingoldianus]|uniref:Uncharacterized protein n=1 Tax=Lindgomyces ingoldianus TaxID=673940 RepID=A0ACB6R7T7_9PLEO|nr:uncharacterized protein BDR25DRAFT_350749 [Lindgomyces ingoldianus]KAF2475369.1 hypothetical protein BDR25DRAFT_350749 [Lindgomyces ingoldianus]
MPGYYTIASSATRSVLSNRARSLPVQDWGLLALVSTSKDVGFGSLLKVSPTDNPLIPWSPNARTEIIITQRNSLFTEPNPLQHSSKGDCGMIHSFESSATVANIAVISLAPCYVDILPSSPRSPHYPQPIPPYPPNSIISPRAHRIRNILAIALSPTCFFSRFFVRYPNKPKHIAYALLLLDKERARGNENEQNMETGKDADEARAEKVLSEQRKKGNLDVLGEDQRILGDFPSQDGFATWLTSNGKAAKGLSNWILSKAGIPGEWTLAPHRLGSVSSPAHENGIS